MKKYYIIGVCNLDTKHVAFIDLSLLGDEDGLPFSCAITGEKNKWFRFVDTRHALLQYALKFACVHSAITGMTLYDRYKNVVSDPFSLFSDDYNIDRVGILEVVEGDLDFTVKTINTITISKKP